MGEFEVTTEEMIESQLITLYMEKELLGSELGTSDPVEIVNLIRNMEKQLVDLYKIKENFEFIENVNNLEITLKHSNLYLKR